MTTQKFIDLILESYSPEDEIAVAVFAGLDTTTNRPANIHIMFADRRIKFPDSNKYQKICDYVNVPICFSNDYHPDANSEEERERVTIHNEQGKY
jgi:hypothetical protein